MVEINKGDFEDKLRKALYGIGLDVQESLKDKLTREHGKDTGALQSSINFDITQEGDVWTISLNMAEQGKYIEYGTPPHMPPVDALKGWAKRKLGDEKLAWAVAYSIKRRGTRPFPFIRPTFNNEVTGIINKNLISAFK